MPPAWQVPQLVLENLAASFDLLFGEGHFSAAGVGVDREGVCIPLGSQSRGAEGESDQRRQNEQQPA